MFVCFSLSRRYRQTRCVALPTDAMRPDNHAAIVGMDPLPYHRTVGAIGIVFATTPTVIVPRPDAKSERANLNACTIRVHASINLSRGGNRPNEQHAGGHSQEQVPHDILLLTLLLCGPTLQSGRCCARKKISKILEPRPFSLFAPISLPGIERAAAIAAIAPLKRECERTRLHLARSSSARMGARPQRLWACFHLGRGIRVSYPRSSVAQTRAAQNVNCLSLSRLQPLHGGCKNKSRTPIPAEKLLARRGSLFSGECNRGAACILEGLSQAFARLVSH